MRAHHPIQSRLPCATYRGAQLLLGLGAALTVLSIIVGFEGSIATARSSSEPSSEIVNRTRKGDRLPLVPAFRLNAVDKSGEISVPRTPALELKLADGCEPLVSPLAHAGLARVAGRCVS